jgi:hypothetical protein
MWRPLLSKNRHVLVSAIVTVLVLAGATIIAGVFARRSEHAANQVGKGKNAGLCGVLYFVYLCISSGAWEKKGGAGCGTAGTQPNACEWDGLGGLQPTLFGFFG